MKYFKINYNKLQNMHQIKYFVVISVILFLIIVLIILSCFINTTKVVSFYGIYNENILKIKIDNKLSDTLKNNKYIEFNGQKTNYKIVGFGEYEIINNKIYQELDLLVDGYFINNEVGIVKLRYNKQKIINYIFELFK